MVSNISKDPANTREAVLDKIHVKVLHNCSAGREHSPLSHLFRNKVGVQQYLYVVPPSLNLRLQCLGKDLVISRSSSRDELTVRQIHLFPNVEVSPGMPSLQTDASFQQINNGRSKVVFVM